MSCASGKRPTGAIFKFFAKTDIFTIFYSSQKRPCSWKRRENGRKFRRFRPFSFFPGSGTATALSGKVTSTVGCTSKATPRSFLKDFPSGSPFRSVRGGALFIALPHHDRGILFGAPQSGKCARFASFGSPRNALLGDRRQRDAVLSLSLAPRGGVPFSRKAVSSGR